MKRAMVFLVLALLAVTLSQGCSRAISEGVEKALGPTAITLQLDPKWPAGDEQYLASYHNFELGKVTSQFPDTPQEFLDYLPTKFKEQVDGNGLPTQPGAKTLVVNIDILAYQPAVSYKKALGPTEEVVTRVTLVDKSTGKPIGRAICIGRTYQSVGLGPKWKAWGLCRAIVNEWIKKYYPEDQLDKDKETKEEPPPKDE